MTQPTYLTRDGLVKLKEELDMYRTTKRQEVAERIQLANAIGGTVDNAEYDEAKKEQAFIEGHIMDLENIINNAAIIENAKGPAGVVKVGSKVTVLNQARDKKEKFHIVGSPEADPAAGRISNVSPIGKAILGKRVEQVAEVKVPAGVLKLKILEIQ
ncbi:MAG: transcription elongation factor GreA [SAR202 cluster bacterium]|nr:transcription elongation factor GreA [SAR202 cluster bacterium]